MRRIGRHKCIAPGKGGFPEEARSAERRIAKRYCARVGRNSVCMCGGRWRASPGVGAGECHTEPAAPGGVARLILLSRSEAR